jgi:hypothetical protein
MNFNGPIEPERVTETDRGRDVAPRRHARRREGASPASA